MANSLQLVRPGTYARSMTMPSRVIYLPPGVVAPQGPSSPPVPATPGIPFDRNFFENILPPAINAFCQQVDCKVPIVEVLTVDGVTHYVNGISGVADQWVALHTTRVDHPHAIQMFVPYQTIFRVEVHPEGDEKRRHLGFVTQPVVDVTPAAEAAPIARRGRSAAKKASS